MSDERQHESEDLEDIETRDPNETLDGNPGDDPLDRGVAAPDRWSAAMRFGTTAAEQESGESLDQQLAEEEPDETADLDLDDDEPLEDDWDENAPASDVRRFERDDDPDPRSGRLVDDDADVYPPEEGDFRAHDAGIDGGAASAEEAAVHVEDLDEDDEDEDDDYEA
jgi:hypothetical protein